MKKNNINANTAIAEIIKTVPKAQQIMIEEYGIFCAGCPMAQVESIGDGAKSHGLSPKELKDLLSKLNKALKS